MRAIFKYQLPIEEVTTVIMPQGAEVIRVGGLDGCIWIWAVVDTDKPEIPHKFHLFKTGGEIPENLSLTYVGCGAIFIQQELMLYVFKES